MGINVRKALCKIFKKGTWPYKACDCQRYETYVVGICSESGKISTAKCLAAGKRVMSEFGHDEYWKLQLCGLEHSIAPPPPPPKTTQEILRDRGYRLVGASCYQLSAQEKPVITAFFEGLRDAGAVCTEAFLFYTWAGGYKNQILMRVGEDYDRHEDGTVNQDYKDYKFPIWDLKQIDPVGLDKWLFIGREAKRCGLSLVIRWHDFCSIKNPFEKRHYPYGGGGRNLQQQHGLYDGGMYAVASGTGQVYNLDDARKIGPMYRWAVNEFIPAMRTTGADTYYVPMNEADALDVPDGIKDERTKHLNEFHIGLFRDAGVSKDHIIISTSRAYNQLEELGYIMEVHGINSPGQIRPFMHRPWLFPNGDGPDAQAQGRVGDRPNKREPSVAQAAEMAQIMIDGHIDKYSYFIRPWDRGIKPGIDKSEDWFDVIRTICERLAR